MEYKERVKCGICGKSVYSRKQLEQHTKDTHSTVDKRGMMKPVKKSFKLTTKLITLIGVGDGIRDAYPINVLTRLKDVPELVKIYCATANPIEVIFVETEQGRAILGVVDGFKPKGVDGK